MNTLIFFRLFALWLLSISAAVTLAFGQCDIPSPITDDYLISLETIPEFIEARYEGDKCYVQIVKLGLPIAEQLIDLLDDPILSEHFVPHWGGHYAVGDIALKILTDIIHIPLVDLLPAVDPQEYETCGFCVYWKYVREDPKNRLELQTIIEQWFNKNRDSLYWKEIPGISPGGQFRLKAEEDA